MPYSGLKFLALGRGDAVQESAFFKEHPIYNKDILDCLDALITHYALSDDSNKLTKVRIENIHSFYAFAVHCL